MEFLFELSKWSSVEIGRTNVGGEPRIGVGGAIVFKIRGSEIAVWSFALKFNLLHWMK